MWCPTCVGREDVYSPCLFPVTLKAPSVVNVDDQIWCKDKTHLRARPAELSQIVHRCSSIRWSLVDEQVLLTDADPAITAAVEASWPDTLHLFCLWHIFKNVLKNCSSSLNEVERNALMRSFKCAAYAATPEVSYCPNPVVNTDRVSLVRSTHKSRRRRTARVVYEGKPFWKIIAGVAEEITYV